MPDTHENLLAPESRTELPEDTAYAELLGSSREEFLEIVKRHPDSLLVWALLAEGSLNANHLGADVAAYAYARTGYHRGLDLLRRNGWRGSGHVPWEHEPNQGFLRALWALSQAAGRLGEDEEAERCSQFLRDSSETAYEVLVLGVVAEDANAPEGDAAQPEEHRDDHGEDQPSGQDQHHEG